MGHGNGIKWYRRIELPGYGIAAATACLEVDPARPPGASYEFFGAANQLAQRAQALRDVLTKLAAIATTEGVWTGAAADGFRTILKDANRSHYDQVPVRYDGFARALRRYGSALDGHQAAIDGARADVQAALDAYHRAESFEPAKGADAAKCPVPSSPLPLNRSCVAVVDDCLAAAHRFQVAYNDWVDAVTTCEHAIERVDDDTLHNPHGTQVVVDQIANVSGMLANLTAVLAVLTLYWPPVALVFLELSSVFSIIQLGADITRKVAWDEHVTGTDFAVDALGSIPVLGPIGKGAKAARAAKAAGAGVKVGLKSLGEDLRAVGPALKKLQAEGLWRTLRHPDPKGMGSTLVRQWDLQDAAALGLGVGQQAFDDRKQGIRQSIEKAGFSVVLGPLSPVGVAALDRAERATGQAADRAAHGAR